MMRLRNLLKPLSRISRRLVASYTLDWVIVVTLGIITYIVNKFGPYKRAFSLVDLSIQYPFVDSQIPTWLLFILSIFLPALIIAIVCLVFVPGKAASVGISSQLAWRRKLWEWHTAWLGFALSHGLALLFTEGLKNAVGKPRPDMLDRCQPDMENFEKYVISSYAASFDPKWVLVSPDICQNSDSKFVDGGFRSFPSGHASMSFAGLLYLALFFCSKFAIVIPYLPPHATSHDEAHRHDVDTLHGLDNENNSAPLPRCDTLSPTSSTSSSSSSSSKDSSVCAPPAHSPPSIISYPPRNRAAAPPLYLLILPLLPLCAACYITATRYFQYHHFGADLFGGAIIGIAASWFSFRWYHLPLSYGAGWAWGARSRHRAWYVGVGTGGYVGTEGWGREKDATGRRDEGFAEREAMGPGMEGPLEDV